MIDTIPLKKVEGVAAGGTATITLHLGVTYHGVILPYTGVTLAQMTAIRVMADGNPMMTLGSGAQLDARNQFDGMAAASGELYIDFERYGLRTKANQRMTALGTGLPAGPAGTNLALARQGKAPRVDPDPIRHLALEIDIDAAAVSPGFTKPKAIVTVQPRPQGVVKRVEKFRYSPGAAGDFEITDLPRNGAINRIFFYSTTAINNVKLELDRVTRFDRTASNNALVQANGQAGRVAQANYFVLDTTEDGYGNELIDISRRAVNDFRIVLDMAAAGDVDVWVEYIGPRAR